MKRISIFKVAFHLLGWVLFFLAPLIFSPGALFRDVAANEWMSLLLRIVTLMIYFYTNQLYIAPVILKKKGLIPFILISAAVITSISVVNSAFHHYYVEGRNMEPPLTPGDFERGSPPMMFAGPTFSSFLVTILVGLISTLLVLWEEWTKVHEEKQEQALQRIAAELTALKLQISPHFLFNTLNNIRWLVRTKSDLAEDAVVKLSQLLRYILYQTTSDKVGLKKELDHLHDFVELQKMRLTSDKAVEWKVEGEVENKQIVPLLLLPIVENFFKHGDFTGDFQNTIQIKVTETVLYFKTENKIDLVEEKEHGIGLSNVMKRLKLHYPDRYLLKYYEKDKVFFLELELMLN